MRYFVLLLVLATPGFAQDYALRGADLSPSEAELSEQIFDRDLIYFDGGTSRYDTDGSYAWTYSEANGGGVWPGRFQIDGNVICVTFESGAERCDMFVMSGDRLTLLTADGDRYPIREIR